jgi:hypothetical protein
VQERDANAKARDAIRAGCVGAVVYKINDRQTKDIPDSVVTWNDATSWLEFKMLSGDADIHTELGKGQLVQLIKLEQQSQRAWVVAYRKATRVQPDRITIYRPTRLWPKIMPHARENSTLENILRDLRTFGVAQVEGFNHGAIVALLHQSHANY